MDVPLASNKELTENVNMNQNEEVPDFLGGHGDLLPADVLKMVNELLEQLHRKEYAELLWGRMYQNEDPPRPSLCRERERKRRHTHPTPFVMHRTGNGAVAQSAGGRVDR